jgi:hypothetical protein
LLGEESKLDMANVKRMVEGLKQESLEDIFKIDQKKGDRIVEELVNDPGVDLKALGKIIKNHESLETVDKLLASNNSTAI